MQGASHLPKGGFSGAEAASRTWDTVFANPLMGRWATEEIEEEQDGSAHPMSRMGSRNVPDVRSLATQPPYTLSERVLGDVLRQRVVHTPRVSTPLQ
jgi:hypothetical protein